MKFMKITLAAAAAAMLLAGCCSTMNAKCYPYPLYDYSPAKVCGTVCAPSCATPSAAPCPVR